MNNLTKKIVAIATGLTFAAMLFPVVPVQAVTAEELQDQIDALLETLADLQDQLAELTGEPTAVECSCTFTRSLYPGVSRGDDVKCLQEYLNDSGHTLAESGAGSPGNETTYFGSLTRAAVKAWQDANDVAYGDWWGYFGPISQAKYDEVCAVGEQEEEEEEEEEVGEGLTVTLADDTPVSATIVASSSLADLTHFTFTNGDESDVVVTELRLKRGGISSDTTLPNLYLFDGYRRLGDESTLSSGYATFRKNAGLFTIPAGGSKTIAVKAEIGDASGQTIQMILESADDITSDASTVKGTYPLSGNLMSVAVAISRAAVDFSASVIPTGTSNIDATADYIVWQGTFTVTQQNVDLEYVRFSQIGSIPVDALDNIRLHLAGVEIATGELVAADVGQELVFDLSDSPSSITKGLTRTMTIYADIVKGSSRTLRMSIEKTADVFFKDASYGNYVLVTVGGLTFSPLRTGIKTINTGTVIVTRRSDSPSGAIVLASNNVSFAKFDIKAMGEEIKINSLRIEGFITGITSVKYLRNVSLLLDGTQIGNTLNVETNYADGDTDYTDFNIYQKIDAGTTKTLEIKGDIYGCAASTCTGSNLLSDGNTVRIRVVGEADLANAQGMVSSAMIDAPAANTDGIARTIGTGDLTLVKSASYGDQDMAAGSDSKIGQYDLTATAYDTVNISSFTLTASTTSGNLTDLSNIYLKYDGTQTSAKGSVSASNVFSVNTSLAQSESMTIEVWATIGTTATTSDEIFTTLDLSATRATDGQTVDPDAVTGQTITIQNGALAVVRASDTPVSAVLVGNYTDSLISKFTFAANYEAFVVNRMLISVPTGTRDDYTGVYIKYKDADSVTITASAKPLVEGTATFDGQTLYVPANDTADVEVYGNMSYVGAGYANSGDRPQLSLTYYRASSGSQALVEGTLDVSFVTEGSGTAALSTATTTSASYSVLLTHTNVAAGSVALEFVPEDEGLTLADFQDDIDAATPEYSFRYNYESGLGNGPQFELQFEDPNSTGWLQVTAVGLQSPLPGSAATWQKETLSGSTTTAGFGGNTPDGSSVFDWDLGTTLDAIEADVNTAWAAAETGTDASDYVLTRVRVELWEASGKYCYIDDIVVNGATTTVTGEIISGNQMVLYNTEPTVNISGATAGTLYNGTNELYKFTVTADAKGDVGMKQIIFNVSPSMSTSADTIGNFRFYRGSIELTDVVSITDGQAVDIEGAGTISSVAATSVIVLFASEEVVTKDTSQTYYLKANITGVSTVGESISTYINDDAGYVYPAAFATNIGYFVWTDRSQLNHSESTRDWTNGYLVDTLATDTYTLSK
jgi:hypothetical protein